MVLGYSKIPHIKIRIWAHSECGGGCREGANELEMVGNKAAGCFHSAILLVFGFGFEFQYVIKKRPH